MGGGRRFPFPKYVWTPYGGWWVEPKNPKLSVALLFAANFTIAYYAYTFAEARTIRYTRKPPPHEFIPVSERGHNNHHEHH